jgi:hypothetical protein
MQKDGEDPKLLNVQFLSAKIRIDRRAKGRMESTAAAAEASVGEKNTE